MTYDISENWFDGLTLTKTADEIFDDMMSEITEVTTNGADIIELTMTRRAIVGLAFADPAGRTVLDRLLEQFPLIKLKITDDETFKVEVWNPK